MKFAHIFVLFLLCMVTRANAQDTYNLYLNARFGTSIEYPANLLIPQRESDNGDGRRFVSRDGEIELTVYGSYNVSDLSTSGAMSRAQSEWKKDGARLTFSKSGPNWYALSGYIGDDIFYEKALLVNDVFHTAIWQYPQSLKKRVDAPLTRSVRSLRVGHTGIYKETPRLQKKVSAPRRRTNRRPAAKPRPATPTRPSPAATSGY